MQALHDRVVPPTLNLKDVDPEIDLDVVSSRPRRGDYRYALTDSFELGGHNVALASGASRLSLGEGELSHLGDTAPLAPTLRVGSLDRSADGSPVHRDRWRYPNSLR
jgi:hypothetical protein